MAMVTAGAVAGCWGVYWDTGNGGRDAGNGGSDAGSPSPPPPAQEQPRPQVPPREPPPPIRDIGARVLDHSAIKPNVMLLVDRSGSMNDTLDCGQSSCPTKWRQLLALGSYLQAVKERARLGLAYFPSRRMSGCSVESSVEIPLSEAPDIDVQILGSLQSTSPGGNTPAAAALDEVGETGRLDATDRANVVVLLTDGRPNCACGGDIVCESDAAVAAVEALALRDPPVKVYVVGFGASLRDVAGETLAKMAEAGGTARAAEGQPKYYQADTVEELVRLLYDVTRQVSPCDYQLAETPAAERLVVTLDGAEVAACTADGCTEGYGYDAAHGRVNFLGASCEKLRDGQGHELWFAERAQ
jgi:hypothetical protein